MCTYEDNMLDLAGNFDVKGTVLEAKAFGSGHINDTFRVVVQEEDKNVCYVMQRLNKSIFPNPEAVMRNIDLVTKHLKEKITLQGGDPDRETLTIIPAKDGRLGVSDENGEYWRMYRFIDGAKSYDQAESTQLFYESAVAFGHFQSMLSDFDASLLAEVLPGFHNTVNRYNDFQKTVKENRAERLSSAFQETLWLTEHEDIAHVLCDRLADGRLPLRVTHNDTKLNNIMMDPDTGKAVCVIDLDTVMPGLTATDFGDAIRFGASTATEDERDISKVSLDLDLYKIYKKGFMEGCSDALTEEEVNMLPWGALVITYEQALRFLGDYLNGDTYYKVDYPEHNLVRARTQIELAKDMIRKFEDMK